jgi:2-dehydropantoate 2-reductase
MKIAVIGAGGVGGYFGAKLANSGKAVTFVARGPHLSAIQRNGLTVLSSLGDIHLDSVHAVGSIAEVEPVDLVLVAVKLWDTDEVARALRPLTDQGAAVLSLQNGVLKDDALRAQLPAESILGGACYISATISSPGVIQHSGTIQRIAFGEYKGEPSPRAHMILCALRQAEIDADISESIERVIWEKFIFLVGLSGTTTAMRQPIGVIRESEQTRSFLLDLMREVVEVGRARGIRIPEDYAQDRLEFCDTLPAAMTSSMHHDLDHGNRLELPWLSGGVVTLAKAVGVATPLNRAVSDILEPFVRGRLS